MPPIPSFLIRPCYDSQVTFCRYIPNFDFHKVSFGGRNLSVHLLIGI